MKKYLCAALALLFVLCCGCGDKMNYYALLAEDNNFAHEDATDIEFTYDFDDPRLKELDKTWGLNEIAGIGDTQARALKLMHWLCAHTKHGNPNLPEDVEWHAQGLLDWFFDKSGTGPNCMMLSIILSECLLAVGVRAYALWCFPKVYRDENHVVVQVWLPEEDCWIMLDPSWDVYVTDEVGCVLSAPELRQGLAEGAPLRQNAEARMKEKSYFDYMAKDMYHFNRARDVRYGQVEHSMYRINLCPAEFNLSEESPIYATYESFWA
ncbi:MAG: transglutaminase-like domain-containing protein [Firmicutes bacterium]|nr:transglutaminase-like domain-containing protein [Bacillota bacterium]